MLGPESESIWRGPEETAEEPLPAHDQWWLEDCFGIHPATPEKGDAIFEINGAAKEFAKTILRQVPPSADRSSALRAVREARMWANASIVLEGRR